MIYELSRAIGSGRYCEYMHEDWKETKEDFHNYVVPFLSKLSYPLTGNLSIAVRERMEGGLGKNVYNSSSSGIISGIANSFVFGYLFTDSSHDFLDHFLVGSVLGLMHAGVRCMIGDRKKNISASLVGKLVSLPIEAGIGIYDGIKDRKINLGKK